MEEYKIYKKGRHFSTLGPLLILTGIAAAIVATLAYGIFALVAFLAHKSSISYGSLFVTTWICLSIALVFKTAFNSLFAIMNNQGIYFPDTEDRILWNEITLYEGATSPCRSSGNYLFLDVASPLHEALLEHELTEDLLFCCDAEFDGLSHRKLILFNGDALEQPLDEIRNVIEMYKRENAS